MISLRLARPYAEKSFENAFYFYSLLATFFFTILLLNRTVDGLVRFRRIFADGIHSRPPPHPPPEKTKNRKNREKKEKKIISCRPDCQIFSFFFDTLYVGSLNIYLLETS